MRPLVISLAYYQYSVYSSGPIGALCQTSFLSEYLFLGSYVCINWPHFFLLASISFVGLICLSRFAKHGNPNCLAQIAVLRQNGFWPNIGRKWPNGNCLKLCPLVDLVETVVVVELA